MNLLVADIETGGLDQDKHSILQIGLIAYKDGVISDRLEFYVKHETYHLTAKAMEINGLDLAEIDMNGLTEEAAFAAIAHFVSSNFPDGLPMMLGHNVGFDRRFISALFARQGKNLDNHINFRVVDTTTIIHVAKTLGKLDMEAPGWLHGLADYFGIKYADAHTALADAEVTIAVYEELLSILGQGA